MLTNAGMDMQAIAAEAERRRMSHEFDVAEAAADAKAQVDAKGFTDANVAVVRKGSEEDLRDEFSFVDDELNEEGMKQAAEKRLRAARQHGHLQRAGILVDGEGRMIGPKVRDKYELDAVAQGVFCWCCGDSQPERMPDSEKERRLKMIGWSLPAGKQLRDCCATCGRILGLQKAG